MKTAIIYHRVDWDGYTAAAVALRAFPDAELIGWNYRDPLPDVDHFDRVILVDLTIYSQKPDEPRDFSWMINNQDRLIWFDHHPIIHMVPGEYCGVQKEGIGACWLVYEYFRKTRGITCSGEDHIRYAATFDVFRKDGWLCDWEDAWAYQLYLNHFGPGYVFGEGDVSKKHVATASALIEASDVEINNHLNDGRMFEYERSLREKVVFEKHARRVKINEYEGWLVETMEQPSVIIKDHSDAGDGDFFILFSENKKNANGDYTVSIRVPDSSDFNAQRFCESHGGGGYIKAAGCVISSNEMQEKFGLLVD